MQEKSSIGTRIAHGALLVGYMSTASTISIAHVIHRTDLEEFPVSAGYDRIRFIRPVLLGDTVTSSTRSRKSTRRNAAARPTWRS
jgi:acyl dehydratase